MANKKKYAPGEKRPRGMRADGRYSGRVTVGHDADGKAVIKTVYGRTRAELEANRAQVKRKYTANAAEVQQDILFGVYVQQFYMAHIADELRDAGKKDYINAINVHLSPEFGERQLRAISAMDLQQWLNTKKDYSQSMINTLYTVTRRIFRTAAAQRYLDYDTAAALRKPKSNKTPNARRPLTPREREAALHVMDTHPCGLLLRVLYCTGARRGEDLAIRGKDIDLQAGTISLRYDVDYNSNAPVEQLGDVKTPAAIRTVPIPPLLRGALEARLCPPDEYLIHGSDAHKPLSKSSYDRIWRSLMAAMYAYAPDIAAKELHQAGRKPKAAYPGKPGPKPKDVEPVKGSILTAHYFRHNYATELYNAEVDLAQAMQWMGHSDLETLLKVYTHPTPLAERRNAAKLAQIFVDPKNM